MVSTIEITPEHKPGLFDSATGDTLMAEKVVDVSAECRPIYPERILFLYTRAKRGRIVQVCYPYDGEDYMGAHIHFFLDEPSCESFNGTAKRLGLSEPALRKLMLANAPAVEQGMETK